MTGKRREKNEQAKGGEREKHKVIIDAISHSHIYLLVIFKWSESGVVGCFSLPLTRTPSSASVLFHLTFKPKKNARTRERENTRAKKCTQDEDAAATTAAAAAAIETRIHTHTGGERENLTVIFHKTKPSQRRRRKKKICSLFFLFGFVRV